MSRTRIAAGVLIALSISSSLAAQQQAERGAFVTRLGTDTISVERFTRTADRLEGDLLLRSPSTRVVHYTATLDPSGRVTRFEASSNGKPPQRAIIAFARDTAAVQVQVGDSARAMQVPLPAGTIASPILLESYALYELLVRQTMRAGADSVAAALVMPGAPEPTLTSVVRRGTDSVAIGFFGMPLMARVARDGRLMGLDGAQTTVKVNVTRSPDANIERLERDFAAQDAAGHALGPTSPRDTVQATVAGAKITVDYGRPAKRGRTIYGGIVPFDSVWRTGANAATGFTTSRALVINGTAVPAGSYTLWTLPSASGAKLIVNRQTGQWGTEYDASRDLARIDLKTATLPQPVERFTIAVEPQAQGGVLRLSWDTTEWSAPFTVR